MSLKLRSSRIPVPKDLEKDSFAANLFAKKDIFVFYFLENFISFLVKVLKIKFFFPVKILILSFLTISTPTPKIFILLNYSLKFFNYIV